MLPNIPVDGEPLPIVDQLQNLEAQLAVETDEPPTPEQVASALVDHLNTVMGDEATFAVQWVGDAPRFYAFIR